MPKLCEISVQICNLKNWTPVTFKWLSGLLVKFNPLKTEAVLFTLKYFEAFPQLIFDNTPIKFVEDHKHLGITISQNGQWHTHIEQIANTASKILGIMRKLKYTLSREQKCIKSNLFIPLITNHRVCIISL